MAIGSTLGLAVVLDKLGASARSAISLGNHCRACRRVGPCCSAGSVEPWWHSARGCDAGSRHRGARDHRGFGLHRRVEPAAVHRISAAPRGSRRRCHSHRELPWSSTRPVRRIQRASTSLVRCHVTRSTPPDGSTETRRSTTWSSRIGIASAQPDHATATVGASSSPRSASVRSWSKGGAIHQQVAEIEAASDTPYSTVGYWRPHRLRLSDRFIADPTAEAGRELRELGVRWIFVDHTRPYAETLEPYAELRFRNPGVDVYELSPPSGD